MPALILSGLNAENFTFIGFLPEKNSQRKALLENAKNLESTLIFYLSPHDVKKDVQEIYSFLGERKCALVKEISKLHEKAIRFTLGDDIEFDTRGEYVFVVEGGKKENPLENLSVEEHFNHYYSICGDKMEAIKQVARDRKVKKSEIYKIING